MGFDLSGYQPRSSEGECFHRNIFAWHPIASWIEQEAPQKIVRKCDSWHTNDYAGLEDADARALAAWIRARIADGSAATHFGLTRVFNPEPHPVVGGVVGALGQIPGLILEPHDGTVDTDDLEEFARFLEDCGGFVIG